MQGGGNGPLEEAPKGSFAEVGNAKEGLKHAILKELEPVMIPILDFLIKIIKLFRRLLRHDGNTEQS